MDWFIVALLAVLPVLLALRLWLGPPQPKEPPAPVHPQTDFDGEEPEPWTAEALAQRGTETSVADLAAQGRADELRGLGYRGDIPGE